MMGTVDGGVEEPGDVRAPLGDSDRELLAFVASQSLVLVSQVQALLRLDEEAAAASRVGSLVAAGLLREGPRLRHQLGGYQITRRGLDAIGSGLPQPRVDLRRYWRELSAGWLLLAGRVGTFGPAEQVYSRREMQDLDRRRANLGELADDPGFSPAVRARAVDASFGLRVGGGEVTGTERRHYPDVLLVLAAGRVAIELELEPTPPKRLAEILAGYREKQSVKVVVYLVQDTSLGRPVKAAAARLGMSDQVHVQRVKLALTGR